MFSKINGFFFYGNTFPVFSRSHGENYSIHVCFASKPSGMVLYVLQK